MQTVIEKLERREIEPWETTTDKADAMDLKVRIWIDDDTENLALWIRVWEEDSQFRDYGIHFNCEHLPDLERDYIGRIVASFGVECLMSSEIHTQHQIRTKWKEFMHSMGRERS